MYYKPFHTTCIPKNWGISDDLGQIEYIFSDKTSTLTQNVMEFQRCSVHGVVYGEGVTEAQCGAAMREGQEAVQPEELAEKLAELKDSMLAKLTKLFKNRYMQIPKLTLVSPKLADDLADCSSEQHSHLIAFSVLWPYVTLFWQIGPSRRSVCTIWSIKLSLRIKLRLSLPRMMLDSHL